MPYLESGMFHWALSRQAKLITANVTEHWGPLLSSSDHAVQL